MSYTLAQRAKSVVAGVGTLAAVVGVIAAYLITSEIADDNVKAWSTTVAGICGVVAAIATRVATFKIPNAPVADADPPPDAEIKGTH